MGIGTPTPNASAKLDVSSTTQGMLIPRMTAAQRALISAPATSLMVYQTDGVPGFYFYNGSAWTSLASNAQSVPTGGTTGQVLAKVNATDYNTQWVTPSSGSPSATTLPNAFYAHGYTFNQPAYYTSPFVFQTQNILGGFLTFLTPAATNFTINFSSFDDEALTFELFDS